MEEIYTIERVYVDSDYNSNPVTVYATHDRKLAENYCTRANRVTKQLYYFYNKKVNETRYEDEIFFDKRRWFKNIYFEVHTVPLLSH